MPKHTHFRMQTSPYIQLEQNCWASTQQYSAVHDIEGYSMFMMWQDSEMSCQIISENTRCSKNINTFKGKKKKKKILIFVYQNLTCSKTLNIISVHQNIENDI